MKITSLFFLFAGLVAAVDCCAQPSYGHVIIPPDVKLLHGTQMRIQTAPDDQGQAQLYVLFYLHEDPIKYSELSLRAFNVEGDEIPCHPMEPVAGRLGVDPDAFSYFGLGKFRKEVSVGAYRMAVAEEQVARVRIAWKGEEIEFSPPPKGRRHTVKGMHGGAVHLSLSKFTHLGSHTIDVLVRKIKEPEIKYAQIKISAFDLRGEPIAIAPRPGDEDTYADDTAGPGGERNFTGTYEFPVGKVPSSKLKLRWGDEEVEFSGDDLVAH